jgi:hypothetical protein
MVNQGRETYGGNGKLAFTQGDLRDGLPVAAAVDPFDLYFSAYGSLSHLNDQELESLLVEIAQHAGEHALVVVDLLGKFSYEWQDEWVAKPVEGMRDYSMSYLHCNGEAEHQEVEHFPMRYWCRQEIEQLLSRVSQQSGRSVSFRRSFDRSILVGRHMDTGLYNSRAPSLRRAVNMLHESNQRTDLRDLLFDYHPRPGFGEVNRFYEQMQMAWNLVVSYCIDSLSSDEMDPEHEDLDAFPEPVAAAVKTVGRVIDNVRWMRMGDPRANIIEPQLAYALRSLEIGLQQGQGYAHGLVGVIEIAD